MPFNYTCERCGKTFTKHCRSQQRFCSLSCRHAPRPGLPGPYGSVIVPLTQGKFAIIDAADAERVLAFNWCAHFDKKQLWYAIRKARAGEYGRMHRLILGATPDELIDHVDGNGLNNRRSNLRPASNGQNIAHAGLRADNTSGFIGVSWDKQGHAWRAMVRSNGTGNYLGLFDSAEDAARTRDRAARAMFGDFAHLNFPDEH